MGTVVVARPWQFLLTALLAFSVVFNSIANARPTSIETPSSAQEQESVPNGVFRNLVRNVRKYGYRGIWNTVADYSLQPFLPFIRDEIRVSVEESRTEIAHEKVVDIVKPFAKNLLLRHGPSGRTHGPHGSWYEWMQHNCITPDKFLQRFLVGINREIDWVVNNTVDRCAAASVLKGPQFIYALSPEMKAVFEQDESRKDPVRNYRTNYPPRPKIMPQKILSFSDLHGNLTRLIQRTRLFSLPGFKLAHGKFTKFIDDLIEHIMVYAVVPELQKSSYILIGRIKKNLPAYTTFIPDMALPTKFRSTNVLDEANFPEVHRDPVPRPPSKKRVQSEPVMNDRPETSQAAQNRRPMTASAPTLRDARIRSTVSEFIREAESELRQASSSRISDDDSSSSSEGYRTSSEDSVQGRLQNQDYDDDVESTASSGKFRQFLRNLTDKVIRRRPSTISPTSSADMERIGSGSSSNLDNEEPQLDRRRQCPTPAESNRYFEVFRRQLVAILARPFESTRNLVTYMTAHRTNSMIESIERYILETIEIKLKQRIEYRSFGFYAYNESTNNWAMKDWEEWEGSAKWVQNSLKVGNDVLSWKDWIVWPWNWFGDGSSYESEQSDDYDYFSS